MRSCFLRWLVIPLICIAIPMQGFAAVASCGPVHHGDGVAGLAAESGHGHASQADADADHGDDLSAADATGSADAIPCGTCSACCAGSMMAPPELRSMAAIGSYEVIVFPPLAVSSALPGTIDRPPLSLPA